MVVMETHVEECYFISYISYTLKSIKNIWAFKILNFHLLFKVV